MRERVWVEALEDAERNQHQAKIDDEEKKSQPGKLRGWWRRFLLSLWYESTSVKE
jgi:hypothetical protein